MERKDSVNDEVEKLMIFSYGQPKHKKTVSCRAYKMLEKLNSRQKERQQAHLNIDAN